MSISKLYTSGFNLVFHLCIRGSEATHLRERLIGNNYDADELPVHEQHKSCITVNVSLIVLNLRNFNEDQLVKKNLVLACSITNRFNFVDL